MIWTLSIVVSVAGIAMASLTFQWWSLSQASLEKRYRRPNSNFITVADTRLHILDEGHPDAPVIVLLPPHWGSFVAWDDWASEVTEFYRIIRLDLPGHGLSGCIPSNDYSMEMYVRILREAVEHLSLTSFTLVGTSFSGIVAYEYAAQSGDQLSALILMNSSGLPRDPKSGREPNMPPPNPLYRLIHNHYRPRGFFEWKLRNLVVNQDRLTKHKIRTYTDMNNRKGRIAEEQTRLRLYQSKNPKAVLEKIRVPTLVQWSTQSPYLDVKQANTFCEYLKNAPTEKVIYVGSGHLIVEDCPQLLAQDARRFLEGHVNRDKTK